MNPYRSVNNQYPSVNNQYPFVNTGFQPVNKRYDSVISAAIAAGVFLIPLSVILTFLPVIHSDGSRTSVHALYGVCQSSIGTFAQVMNTTAASNCSFATSAHWFLIASLAAGIALLAWGLSRPAS